MPTVTGVSLSTEAGRAVAAVLIGHPNHRQPPHPLATCPRLFGCLKQRSHLLSGAGSRWQWQPPLTPRGTGPRTPRQAQALFSIAAGASSLSAKPLVAPSYPARWPVPFNVVLAPSNVTENVTVEWDFGVTAQGPRTNPPFDSASPSRVRFRGHGYGHGRSCQHQPKRHDRRRRPWSAVHPSVQDGKVLLSWPSSAADVLLEEQPSHSDRKRIGTARSGSTQPWPRARGAWK